MTRYQTVDFGSGYRQVAFEEIPEDIRGVFNDLTNKARKDKKQAHYQMLPDGTKAGAHWDEYNKDVRYWLWNKEYSGWKCDSAAKFASGFQGQTTIFFGHRKPK